jgi:hypothetical protein
MACPFGLVWRRDPCGIRATALYYSFTGNRSKTADTLAVNFEAAPVPRFLDPGDDISERGSGDPDDPRDIRSRALDEQQADDPFAG